MNLKLLTPDQLMGLIRECGHRFNHERDLLGPNSNTRIGFITAELKGLQLQYECSVDSPGIASEVIANIFRLDWYSNQIPGVGRSELPKGTIDLLGRFWPNVCFVTDIRDYTRRSRERCIQLAWPSTVPMEDNREVMIRFTAVAMVLTGWGAKLTAYEDLFL